MFRILPVGALVGGIGPKSQGRLQTRCRTVDFNLDQFRSFLARWGTSIFSWASSCIRKTVFVMPQCLTFLISKSFLTKKHIHPYCNSHVCCLKPAIFTRVVLTVPKRVTNYIRIQLPTFWYLVNLVNLFFPWHHFPSSSIIAIVRIR